MPGSARSARRARRTFDIWPGFVDALATLLILIIFVLMVFMVSQFFLSEALTGRDKALDRLNARINELSEMLSLEKDTSENLRRSMADIASQLQVTISARDTLDQRVRQLVSAVGTAGARIAELEANLAGASALAASLESDLAAVRLRAGELESDLAASTQRTVDMEAELALALQRAGLMQKELEASASRATTLETDLDSANQRIAVLETAVVAANQHVRRLQQQLALANQQIALLDEQLGEAMKRAQKGDTDLAASAQRSESLEADLAASAQRSESLEADLAASAQRSRSLEADLAASAQRSQSLEADLAAEQERQAGLESRLAAAAERVSRLEADLEASRQRRGTLEARLRSSEEARQKSGRALTEEQRLSEQARAAVNLLNAQIAALRRQLASLQEVLDASEVRVKDQKVQIADLGRRLNMALAEKVQELKRYRSEFFGRLHAVLGDRADIRVVGDRFVFQSELLFASASAALEDGGAAQLSQLASTLKEVAAEIPRDIDWVLRVDGHTDRVPINNEEFSSNWELSTARAISVVKFLMDRGIPPNRLAATGFGEFQPLDPAHTPAAYRKNRRIELKLTQRYLSSRIASSFETRPCGSLLRMRRSFETRPCGSLLRMRQSLETKKPHPEETALAVVSKDEVFLAPRLLCGPCLRLCQHREGHRSRERVRRPC